MLVVESVSIIAIFTDIIHVYYMQICTQSRVRDSRAGYIQSLEVLKAAKECGVFTKSSLMLGLGEEDSEVIDAMLDLRDAGKAPPKALAIVHEVFDRTNDICIDGSHGRPALRTGQRMEWSSLQLLTSKACFFINKVKKVSSGRMMFYLSIP